MLTFVDRFSTYSSQTSPLLKQKLLCPLPFAKGKTGSSCFLKFCFCKGAATFLVFFWNRCGHFLRGKLALVKGQLLFWDPFNIEPATFLEINISKGAAAFFESLWNRAGHFFEINISNCIFHIWTSIMASNGNIYKSRGQWGHYIMWIQLGRATIKIQPKFGLCKIFITDFLWIFCIYLNKERSY